MIPLKDALELAMPAERWEIQLRDGEQQLAVLTHAYSVEGDEVVFSLLFKGSPHQGRGAEDAVVSVA